MISLLDVQRGFDRWAAKPHNAKWVRRIDGTPIANDIVVNIFDELKDVGQPAPGDKTRAFLPTGDGEFNGNVAEQIVPPHCSGYSFVFEPGVLHVKKDGSGYIAVNEDDFVLEDDRCEGPDGPEGSVHWIVRLDASEIVALRDFLNGTPAQPAPAELSVGSLWAAKAAVLRSRGKSNTLHDIDQAADYLDAAAAMADALQEKKP